VKTAVSIPEPLLASAQELAAELGISRSQLFSEAVREFIEHRRPDPVTEALNRVYSRESSQPDPVLQALQWASIPPFP
jgi:metal-responsive CopG/Arc/MetJ family transcriptional regulator